jgi:hypothetical protein
MKTNGILPSIALERLNRGVITYVDLIDADRLLITSSAGVFIVEGDTDKQGITCLFWSEVDHPPKEG